MNSKDSNVQQLRHDLRNGPAHVFGDHTHCNPLFCKHNAPNSDHPLHSDNICEPEMDEAEISQLSLTDHIACITSSELENEPTSEEEEIARSAHNASLSCLPDGLLRKVMACGDRLVTLAPQLISNLTSNLAELYAPYVMEENNTIVFRGVPLNIDATQQDCTFRMVLSGG